LEETVRRLREELDKAYDYAKVEKYPPDLTAGEFNRSE
jgi:hypothetical protein